MRRSTNRSSGRAICCCGGLTLAFLAGLFLARKMIVPIQALREGAAQIGGGNLEQRISIKTGDELEVLADQFNDMAGRLEESYAGLEQKVEERTHELSESLAQQTATSEVLQVIASSPGELEPVFQTMLENATRICEAEVRHRCFCARATTLPRARLCTTRRRRSPEFSRARPAMPPIAGHASVDRARPDQAGRPHRRYRRQRSEHRSAPSLPKLGGARTFVVVPMLKEDELIGAIGIYRQEVRPFTDKQIELVTNFANQAVIAIENVRLLNELRARTDELARSVGELQALGEVSQAVNSTLDLETVLTTIVGQGGAALAHRRRRDLRVRRGSGRSSSCAPPTA